MTQEEFALAICKIQEDTGLSYLDSIVLWAEQNQCEIETAAAMVKKDPLLKAKLKAESISLNLIVDKVANTLF